MQIIYTKKPKIHMLRNGKSVCGRRWLDGEEEGSKFAGSVDCKDCLRLLTQRVQDASLRCASDLHQFPGDYSECPFCGATLRQ